MKVIIPKKWSRVLPILEEFHIEKIGETEDSTEYDAPFGFGITNRQLGLDLQKFREFANDIRVEGGRKRRRKLWLFVTPISDHRITLRLPKRWLELLEQYAKDRGESLAEAIRDAIGNALIQWLETREKPEVRAKQETEFG
jgi:hypothetical protein